MERPLPSPSRARARARAASPPPPSFLARMSTFLRTHFMTGLRNEIARVRDGIDQVSSAISPRRKRRLSPAAASPSSYSGPFDVSPDAADLSEAHLPSHLSALPPPELHPPKRRRTGLLPPTPVVAVTSPHTHPFAPAPSPSASTPAPSPFARAPPPQFGPLHPPTRTPSLNPASDSRPRNAHRLNPVLRVNRPSALPRARDAAPAFGHLHAPDYCFLSGVFKYPTPRPRSSPSHYALHSDPPAPASSPAPVPSPTPLSQLLGAHPLPPTPRSALPDRRHSLAAVVPVQSSPLRPSAASPAAPHSAALQGRRISLPPSHPTAVPPREPRARPKPAFHSAKTLNLALPAHYRSSPAPPSVKKSLIKPTSRRKQHLIPRLVDRQSGKLRNQNAAKALAAEQHNPSFVPNGSIHEYELAPDGIAKDAVKVNGITHGFKEFPGLDSRVLRENVNMDLVYLLEEVPAMRDKIMKLHGPSLCRIIEAQTRERNRESAIKAEEERGIRIRAKAEVAKGGLQKWIQRFMKPSNEAEQPPADAQYMNEVYWSDEEEDWDEEADAQAVEERKRKVTVQPEKSAYAALTGSALKRLRQTMTATEYSTSELANINGCIISGQDLARLRPGVWLNDEIVNSYLELLGMRNQEQGGEDDKENSGAHGVNVDNGVPKVRIMNSFFYAKLVQFNRSKGCSVYDYTRVRRWTRRFDVFSYDMMLIPINQQNTHWTLGVVNFKEKWVQHLDSMGTGGSVRVREHLLAWVRDEAADKNKPFVQSEWSMPERDVPRQENSDDCGVFLCKFADFLSRGWSEFTFSQQHMSYFRSRIAHELLMGRVA